MRFRRQRIDRADGEFGRPLIQIDYARVFSYGGRVPIAYMVEGATEDDHKEVLAWLEAVKSSGGAAALDTFIPKSPSERRSFHAYGSSRN